MSLIKCLSELLDLPASLALSEGQAKLSCTYMFVNDKLVWVEEIIPDGVYYTDNFSLSSKLLKKDDVISMKVWLPKTGVYYKKNSSQTVVLHRKPVRQWKRSFNPDFYTMDFFDGEFSVFDIDVMSHREFWVRTDKSIWYMDEKAGYIKDSDGIVCTTKYLEQELIDWARIL